jgi:ribonuclease-3
LGYKASQEFIKKQIIKELPQIIKSGSFRDSKSNFQEKAQEKTTVTPTYKILEEWGPDHVKHFKVGVFLKEALIAEGEGSSKQEAEVKAAEKALEIKNWL